MDGYDISADRGRLDVDTIHRYLSEESYWARGRPRERTERAIANSLCFGLYAPDGRQAGFARVVTDYATFAWLCDVFVLAEHRGRGLGKRLVQAVVECPELAGMRIVLRTADAEALYARYGFGEPQGDPYLERTP